jgi:hypothetical protein
MGSRRSNGDYDSRPGSRAGSVVLEETRARVPPPPPPRKVKKQHPQKSIEEFWDKFTTKHPGKIFTVLPDNLYAKRAAAHAPKGTDPGQNAIASYEHAAAVCRAKVAKISKDCRRINQKYRDPHFDIEADFKRTRQFPQIPPDCLCSLMDVRTDLQPQSVKRVEVWSLYMRDLCG